MSNLRMDEHDWLGFYRVSDGMCVSVYDRYPDKITMQYVLEKDGQVYSFYILNADPKSREAYGDLLKTLLKEIHL